MKKAEGVRESLTPEITSLRTDIRALRILLHGGTTHHAQIDCKLFTLPTVLGDTLILKNLSLRPYVIKYKAAAEMSLGGNKNISNPVAKQFYEINAIMGTFWGSRY